jgi:SAM-dependent methyltransferase
MDARSPERIRHHYDVERELADRLRHATAAERRHLYNDVYNELYSRVPDIPHLSQSADPAVRKADVERLIGFLGSFLSGKRRFLEIGPGDFKLSIAVSAIVETVYAADVTNEVVSRVSLPPNVKFVLVDGFDIDVPEGSIDVAFSDQVMEHLHPDDAAQQLSSIFKTLAPGGCYICITPNRLYGPHDISQYFDPVARGLHLKEYTVSDVVSAFKAVGFSRIETFTTTDRRSLMRVPVPVVRAAETFLEAMPPRVCRGLACSDGFKWLLRSRVVGTK